MNDYLLSRHTIYIGFECHTGHKIHIWAWLLLSPGIRISKKGYKTTLGIKCVFWKGKKKKERKVVKESGWVEKESIMLRVTVGSCGGGSTGGENKLTYVKWS